MDCSTIIRSKSNQYPILLKVDNSTERRASPFKFMKIWSNNLSCRNVINDAWKNTIVSFLMFILSQKLKNLKARLNVCNKNIICDGYTQVSKALSKVDAIQRQINEHSSLDNLV